VSQCYGIGTSLRHHVHATNSPALWSLNEKSSLFITARRCTRRHRTNGPCDRSVAQSMNGYVSQPSADRPTPTYGLAAGVLDHVASRRRSAPVQNSTTEWNAIHRMCTANTGALYRPSPSLRQLNRCTWVSHSRRQTSTSTIMSLTCLIVITTHSASADYKVELYQIWFFSNPAANGARFVTLLKYQKKKNWTRNTTHRRSKATQTGRKG